MNAHRAGPQHVHATFVGDGLRFDVEIVDHFHVIGDEADGHYDYVGSALQPAQYVRDVGLEPGL